MLTIDEASNILTELQIQADPFTVKRWIRDGQLRVSRADKDEADGGISEESLRRIIRRHFRDLHEKNQRLKNERDALARERDTLRNQLAQWQQTGRQSNMHIEDQQMTDK